jgi:hypothetical protein
VKEQDKNETGTNEEQETDEGTGTGERGLDETVNQE